MRIGFALGGGGARGAAHIGVLKVLHEAGIHPAAIAGTSAGSTIGAMFAATLDPLWVESHYRSFLRSVPFQGIGTNRLRSGTRGSGSILDQLGRYVQGKVVMTLARTRRGFLDRDKLVDAVNFLLPAKRFEDLRIPMRVIATDVNTGQEFEYSSGDLVEAVVESSSIPGFIPPLEKAGQMLVDGGVFSPIPINALQRMDVDFSIAVDIAHRKFRPLGEFNLLGLISRCEQVSRASLSTELAAKADFVIAPDVGEAAWSEFSRTEEFISKGTVAAMAALPGLRATMAREPASRWRNLASAEGKFFA